MTDHNDIAHIESYLMGKMDDEERQAFERQMASDQSLQDEVEAYRKIYSGFAGMKEERFARQVEKWTNEAKMRNERPVVPIKRQAKRRTIWLTVAVAASVLLLLGLGANWWAGEHYSNEAIVARAYAPPLSGGTMGANQGAISQLELQYQEAHELFRNEQYDEAIQVLGQFMVGLRQQEALIDPLTFDAYYTNARWTMLLSLYSTGITSETDFRTQLRRISGNPANEYAQRAGEVLKDLNSFWRKLD